uniref:TACC_C domain-containing protein n=1 Tax=Macrostomum lignano TaxID=282301 RepID=A0A1I8FX00_9PLAT
FQSFNSEQAELGNPFLPSRRLARSPPPAATPTAVEGAMAPLASSQPHDFVKSTDSDGDAVCSKPLTAPAVTISEPEVEAKIESRLDTKSNSVANPENVSAGLEVAPEIPKEAELEAAPEVPQEEEPEVPPDVPQKRNLKFRRMFHRKRNLKFRRMFHRKRNLKFRRMFHRKRNRTNPIAVQAATQGDPELHRRLLEAEAQVARLVEENGRLRFDVDCSHLVFGEFDRCLRRLNEQKLTGDRQVEGILREKIQALEDLRSMEAAFTELHRRFERSKLVVEALRNKEAALNRCASECQTRLARNEQRYHDLKALAETRLEAASRYLAEQRRAADADVARLQAVLRKAELRTHNLQAELDQRVRENAELTSICDELIRQVGQDSDA